MNTRLSVNVNKIATLRNARGGNIPNLLQVVKDLEQFGVNGITVHPRPDERHITLNDTYKISKLVKTNFNIEGYPNKRFLKIISDIKPEQATLVPDGHDVVTSNQGWNSIINKSFLKDIVVFIQSLGTKVSVFVNPDIQQVIGSHECGFDRIELYTGPYSAGYLKNKNLSIKNYISAAEKAKEFNMDVNAGPDLNLNNLEFLKFKIPFLFEVSIGHALISDSLYFGLENTIKMYLSKLK